MRCAHTSLEPNPLRSSSHTTTMPPAPSGWTGGASTAPIWFEPWATAMPLDVHSGAPLPLSCCAYSVSAPLRASIQLITAPPAPLDTVCGNVCVPTAVHTGTPLLVQRGEPLALNAWA